MLNPYWMSTFDLLYEGDETDGNQSAKALRQCPRHHLSSKDWVAKFLGLGPAFHHTSGVGGGIIQNTAG